MVMMMVSLADALIVFLRIVFVIHIVFSVISVTATFETHPYPWDAEARAAATTTAAENANGAWDWTFASLFLGEENRKCRALRRFAAYWVCTMLVAYMAAVIAPSPYTYANAASMSLLETVILNVELSLGSMQKRPTRIASILAVAIAVLAQLAAFFAF